jgi:hypothetical protein
VRIAVGVSAIVIAAAALALPGRARAAGEPSLQNTESKQPSQADVEAQLARMLEELKRENARRGMTAEPAKSETPAETAKPEAAKLEGTKSAPAPPAIAIATAPPPVAAATPIEVPPPPAVPPVIPEPPVTVVSSAAEAARAAGPPPVRAPTPPPVAVPEPPPVAAPVLPSGVRSALPAIEGFIAADVQALLGVPSTVQQGPRGTVMWHYLTPEGRQFVYFVNGVATATAPGGSAAPAAPPRRTPGLQGLCEGVSSTTGVKAVAVINPGSPVFIEPKFRTQPLTLLPTKKTAEVVSAEGAWYLIRFNDERWGRRVGYIHCSDVARQDR